METADMVKVAVSAAPYSIDKPYSYLVPESLAAAAVPGVRVMVPFGRGNKESEGLILARVQEPKLPGSKAIRQILDSEPVLDKAGIDLALWNCWKSRAARRISASCGTPWATGWKSPSRP